MKFNIFYILEKLINRYLQQVLFIMAFLTFGVGDGLTAIYMIETKGIMSEINPLMRFFYVSYGKEGLLGLKIWAVLMILLAAWTVTRKPDTYWTVNGFLLALFIGGIMAMKANMMSAAGLIPPSAISIIATYLACVLLFILTGDILDRLRSASLRFQESETTSFS